MATKAELDEVFPSPSVREVAFEVRFAPRLRIVPEVWRIQDKLAEAYPQVGEEVAPQSDGRVVKTYVFANQAEQRLIKVSQETFLVVANRYTTFENFKAEAMARVVEFSAEFEIRSYQRVGLRYVNHIEMAAVDGLDLLQRYVNLPIDLKRFPHDDIEQFLSEFRVKAGQHKLTVRGAMIPLPTSPQTLLYILDLDCYSASAKHASSVATLMDEFHYHIQSQFLDHVTDEYKTIMRGAK